MHPEIEKYSNDPLYAYLNKKVITLLGRPPAVPERTILLMESCGLLSFRLGSIQANIKIMYPDGDMNVALDKLYAPLAASSFGDVPTIEEFMALPNEDIYLWTQEARAVNAGFFEWIDAAEQLVAALDKEQEKKKGRKRTKSASS